MEAASSKAIGEAASKDGLVAELQGRLAKEAEERSEASEASRRELESLAAQLAEVSGLRSCDALPSRLHVPCHGLSNDLIIRSLIGVIGSLGSR